MAAINPPISEAAIRHLIAERAYQLWESHGRPHGYEQIHWHQAEQEIMSCMEAGKPVAPGPPDEAQERAATPLDALRQPQS
jgi:hypothetical protein